MPWQLLIHISEVETPLEPYQHDERAIFRNGERPLITFTQLNISGYCILKISVPLICRPSSCIVLPASQPMPFLFYCLLTISRSSAPARGLDNLRDNEVTVQPIAGTRKRGKTKAEDRALAEDCSPVRRSNVDAA